MSGQRFSLSYLKSLPKAEQDRVLSIFSDDELRILYYDWNFMARDKQLAPPGDWRIWLLLSGRAFGKAISVETAIPTPSGWTTMGELKVGDSVFDEAGKICQVLQVYEER